MEIIDSEAKSLRGRLNTGAENSNAQALPCPLQEVSKGDHVAEESEPVNSEIPIADPATSP